ncbi:MAG: glycosyltransferase family 4 protein [Rhodobacteraceae bacterium]|nr:glycosyltransferase family 4 protein [Paracoccaceae bacterium]
MKPKALKVMIIGPNLSLSGGVANYYTLFLPMLQQADGVEAAYVTVGRGEKSSFLSPLRDQCAVRRAIETGRPMIVHLNPSLSYKSFFRDAFIVMSAKRKNIPVIVFFRGWSRSFERLIDLCLRPFFLRTYGRADAFIVLASEFERKLTSWGVRCAIHRTSTMVDSRGIDQEVIRERLSSNLKSPSPPLKLLFMSRVEISKGVLETVEAVSRLVAKGVDVRLTIAGNGNGMARLQELVSARPHLKSRITITGYVRGDERRHLLETHDVFCLPTSHGEGMPTAVLEAMAFGLVVVTRPVGGLVDFFLPSRMGCYAEDVSPAAIEEVLLPLFENRQKLVEIGLFNMGYAKEHFYAERVSNEIIKIYKEVGA